MWHSPNLNTSNVRHTQITNLNARQHWAFYSNALESEVNVLQQRFLCWLNRMPEDIILKMLITSSLIVHYLELKEQNYWQIC